MQANTGTASHRALVIAATLTATATGGCSYMFMPSPAAVAKQPNGCTNDEVVPGVDVGLAFVTTAGSVLSLLVALVGLSFGSNPVPMLGVGLGFAGSAVGLHSSADHGYASAEACRRAHAPTLPRPAPRP